MKSLFIRTLIFFEIKILELHRRAIQHSRFTLILTLIFFLFSLSQLPNARFVLSTEDMAGDGIQSVEALRNTRSLFQDGYQSTVFLIPPEKGNCFTHDQLKTLKSWFNSERIKHPELQSSFSSFDVMKVIKATQSELKYGAVLNDDDELLQSFSFFDKGPWPLLKGNEVKHPIVYQLVFRPNENTRYGTFDPGVLKEYRNRIQSELVQLIPGVGIHFTGEADYQWYVLEGLNRSKLLNLFLILFLSVLIMSIFRSVKIGFIFLFILFYSGIATYGAKSFFDSPFDLLSSSLFIFLGISTLEDFVFVIASHRSGKSLLTSIRLLVVPSFYTSLTTSVGFISLCTSPVGMVRKFGFWASFGGMLEWILIFIVLPAGISFFKKNKRWVPVGNASWKLTRFMEWRLPKKAVLILLLFFPFAIFSAWNLKMQDSPESVFPVSHPYSKDLNQMKAIHGWKAYVFLVFNDEVPMDKINEVILKLESPLFQKDVVAVETLEKSVHFISQGLSEVDKIVIDREMRQSVFGRVFLGGVANYGKKWKRAILYLKEFDVNSIQNLQKKIEPFCMGNNNLQQDCYLAGNLVAFADFSEKISLTLYWSLFTSLFFVFLILAVIAIRKSQEKNLLWIILSAFWGPAVMLCVLLIADFKINFSTCIFLSILVGLTGDNAIQYLYSSKRGNLGMGIGKKAWASIMTTSSMAIASLVFLGAYFAPPKKLGVLLFLGLLISLFGDVWILKALLHKTEQKT